MKKVRSKLRPTEIGVIKTFSLSPDDEVGEIAVQCSGCTYYYNNLSELCEKWEDYEALKEKYHWFISGRGTIEYEKDADDYFNRGHKAISNYFETKEEAEKALERLRAWKRLKDKGFKFELWDYDGGNYQERIKTGRILFRVKDYEENDKDLDLLFGGEE